jgi:hypothetical protein
VLPHLRKAAAGEEGFVRVAAARGIAQFALTATHSRGDVIQLSLYRRQSLALGLERGGEGNKLHFQATDALFKFH